MNDYERMHRNAMNLLIHAVTVPLFALAVAVAFACPWLARWEAWWGASVALGVYSAVMQRFGHRLEDSREPTRSWSTAAVSFLAEQFLKFPIFVLSGGWSRNWQRARGRRSPSALSK